MLLNSLIVLPNVKIQLYTGLLHYVFKFIDSFAKYKDFIVHWTATVAMETARWTMQITLLK